MANCWRRPTPRSSSRSSRRCWSSAPPAAPRTSRGWRSDLADAKLDALIIIGDDQHEQFFDDNMPAILIYWGDTIENNPLHMDEDAPHFWRKARSQFHETEKTRALSGRRQARPASDRKPGRPGLRRQPGQAAGQGARRRPRLRLRAPAHDERARHPDRAGGAQHLFPAQPAAAAPLLRARPGDPRRRCRARRATRASASSPPAA